MSATRSLAPAPLSAAFGVLSLSLFVALCGSGTVAVASPPPASPPQRQVQRQIAPVARRVAAPSGLRGAVSAGRVLPTRLTHGATSVGGAGNLKPGAHGGMHDGTASLNGNTLTGRAPR